MDTKSPELLSAMDELEAAIKPCRYCQCIHCREAIWLMIDALNEARYLLIHDKGVVPCCTTRLKHLAPI